MDLLRIYKRLFEYFGPQHWWPARTRFEVIAGAILTQNTNWNNVQKAIKNLRRANLLSAQRLDAASLARIEKCIQPSGFYKQKAARLKDFLRYLKNNVQYSLSSLFKRPLPSLRKELLGIKGIGEETADSILLYAAGLPVFVIDAYTRRIFHRLGIRHLNNYEEWRSFFERHLPKDLNLYQEFHALLVRLGKTCCKKIPLCQNCPLQKEKCGGENGNT